MATAIYNPPPDGLTKIRYLFIDGGCLDSVLATFSKELLSDQEIEIDYSRLAQGYHKVFYYDCLPDKKTGENDSVYQNRIKPKIDLFNKLKSLDRFHVYEGTARFRDKRRGQEQKQVDIMIAVDMLTHSFRRNMHEATLITGDLDFKPLIDALVQDGMYVSLWYPKGRVNCELVDAADSKQPLRFKFVQQWFTNSFNSKINTPDITQPPFHDLDNDWRQLETIEKNYKAFLYEKQSNFAAIVKNKDGDDFVLKHNNLNQLKFYVDHVYGLDVSREYDH
jgi:uncharacterized LabA/DUF88 family protein